MVEAILRDSRTVSTTSSAGLAAARRSTSGRPSVSQTASAASSRPGSSSTGRSPANPSAAVSPGDRASPCSATRPSRLSADTLESLRPVPVPPMPTMMSASPACSALSRLPLSRSTRAAALQIGADELRCRGDQRIVAHRHQPRPRHPQPDRSEAEGGDRGDVGEPQPLAGAPQRLRRMTVAAGRQHAVAGEDRGQRLRAARPDLDRVERGDAVGARWHWLADLDALRRAAEHGLRVTAGAQGIVGADRPAVRERDRRLRPRAAR